jgi:hypothetical protein
MTWALTGAVVLVTALGLYTAAAPRAPQRVVIQGWATGDDPTCPA